MKKIVIILLSILPIAFAKAQNVDFDTVLQAAQNGNVEAQAYVGWCYATGTNVTKNSTNAFAWFSKAAEGGNADAQCSMGVFYYQGIGVKKDESAAAYWMKKAAENNNVEAQFVISSFYYSGIGIPQDYHQAFYWCQKAAELGHIGAQGQLGLYYSLGLGTGKDKERAVYWYKKAAELGDANAQSNLGDAYENGQGINKDYQLAFYWYKKSAEQGDMFGMNNLANCYAKGHGVVKDCEQAIYWYQKSIEKNLFYAYYGLAVLYASGEGVSKNDKIALEYLTKGDKVLMDFVGFYDKAAVLRDKGEIYYFLKDINKAKEIWKELQKDYPYEIGVYLSHEDEVFVHAMQSSISKIDFDIPVNTATNTETFAFIFANEDYRRVEAVPFAKNDGKIFAEYCKKTIGVPEKNLHLVTNATLGDMKYNVSIMKQISDAFDGSAKFIIYYAGHGLPADNQQDAYILPVDGYGADGTGYSINELYRDLSELRTKSVMLFLDACFSGAKREGGMIASSRGASIKAKSNMPKGNLVVFSAAQGDETAYPYKEQGHGLFTYFLLKKIQEMKGDVTLGELSDYIISGVKKTSIVENGKIQTPTTTASNNIGDWRNWKLR